MTEETRVVVVDIGNSAAKLCLSDIAAKPDRELDVQSVRFDDPSWASSAVTWIHQQATTSRLHWRIASVNASAADELESAIRDLFSSDSFSLSRVGFDDVPMTVSVDQPERLGIDRLLAAYAASNRYRCPLVVVDAGSAVTVDWVGDENNFCGGAILPGLRLQAESLAAGTDALPRIDWSERSQVCAPGTNTFDAIRLGVLHSVAAGIDRLSARYIQEFTQTHDSPQQSFYILLTGGDSQALSSHLYSDHLVVPNLVCQGLFDLPN